MSRLALKLATGAGKTTVMAMLIAWQTVNAVRHKGSKTYSNGFLIVTPGLTIKDRLRVLQPHDPDSYYFTRELVPHDILGVRALGTQLLCEQVMGRALRRQSYDLNEDGLFNPEYADIFGIPFDFTAKPVVAPPKPPIETVQVKAVRPERDHLEIRFPRVEGYRAELPAERLTATFDRDSVLELTPDLVGPSKTRSQGIIGAGVDMTLEHLAVVRPSTLLFELTKHLLYSKFRDPGEEPKLHLFGQLKRITRQWLDTSLVCKGGTHPALLMYRYLADEACNRITAGITQALADKTGIKVLLDPFNPTGSTAHVRFTTSKTDRWSTIGPPPKNHVNWVVLDSDWEAELCRVVEAHPQVVAYTKNHNLGFEVPYRYGSESRRYRPDFIVLMDDGRGASDLLRLVVETKGYRREDAKDKKLTMETYWIPRSEQPRQLWTLGLPGTHGRVRDRERLRGKGCGVREPDD